MFDPKLDLQIRKSAFAFLEQLNRKFGDVLPWSVLAYGFDFRGERIHLIGPNGIFKPKIMELPLSIRTAPDGPYDDNFDPDGLFLKYRYRDHDLNHRDNVGLREVHKLGLPLIYFHGTIPGTYVAHWPVFVIQDMPQEHSVGVTFDESSKLQLQPDLSNIDPQDVFRRRYKTAEIRIRLHQQVFRGRVLRAYRNSCALCRLRHSNLLDAAHIIPDNENRGEPIVSNGLSLCKLHHAAFDSNILGISPDFIAEIRDDILDEIDGPMLQHGLKEMHRTRIVTPFRSVDKPNRGLLEIRYKRFKDA